MLVALKWVHDQDIVHRDLKLENIMINYDYNETGPNPNFQIKLIDFGLGTVLQRG